MDSWTPKQIAAMEKSGGNAKLLEYFEARGIPKSMKIATKYNTAQAAHYRECLAQELEGKSLSLPDPGRLEQAAAGNRETSIGNKSTNVVKTSKPPTSNCFDFDFGDDWGNENMQMNSGPKKPVTAPTLLQKPNASSEKVKAPAEVKAPAAEPKPSQPAKTCASAAIPAVAAKRGLGEPDDFFAQFGC